MKTSVPGLAVLTLIGLLLSPLAVSHALDRIRAETGVDKAVALLGVSGEGVIVAILDRGIDWESNDFRNEDGSTRIAYIFDMGDDSGESAPGNPYGRGTIYTSEQINRALSGGGRLPTRDADCWQVHDVAVTPDGTIYAGENDSPYRSGYLWEIRI